MKEYINQHFTAVSVILTVCFTLLLTSAMLIVLNKKTPKVYIEQYQQYIDKFIENYNSKENEEDENKDIENLAKQVEST